MLAGANYITFVLKLSKMSAVKCVPLLMCQTRKKWLKKLQNKFYNFAILIIRSGGETGRRTTLRW